MTKKASMRTKVERNCKKTVQQKVTLNHPSPKVVLNANDCARFLDSMGKTSVLLAEKESKMVTATSRSSSVQPSPTSTSLESSPRNMTPTFGAATQTKVYKNWAHFNTSSDVKLVESSDTTASKSSSTVSAHQEHMDGLVPSKTFLKPPKKRRGIEKKFDNMADAPVGNCGEVHSVASFTEQITESPCGQIHKDAALLTIPASEELQGRVELLLQHQLDSSVNINNNQKPASGAYCHESRPYVSPSHNVQLSSSSSSLDATSLSLSSSSASINMDSYSGRAAYTSQLYAHSYNPAIQSSYNHAYLNHTGPASCSVSLPLSHLVSVGKTAHSGGFQQLPEQLEPMNLSTSCKPAVGLVTLHTPSTTDSQTAEDVSAAIAQKHSLSHILTESRSSPVSTAAEKAKLIFESSAAEAINPNHTLPETAQDMSNSAAAGSHLQTTNPVHQSVVYDCVSARDNSDSQSAHVSTLDPTVVSPISHKAVSIMPTLDPTVVSQISDKCVPIMPIEVPYEETAVLSSNVQNQVVEVLSKQCLATNDSCPLEKQAQDSISPIKSLDSSSTMLVLPSPPQDSQTVGVDNSKDTCKELPTTSENEIVVKKPRKMPKKREIPMDEVSCVDRIHRYSLTIDDVITNFVYIPEPVEEFSLTEEEEAAIRNQFENVENINKKDVPVDSLACHLSPGAGSSDNTASQLSMPAGQSESSLASDHASTTRPPKKRPTVVTSDKATEASQTVQQTVEHIDSVLAFVAADYSSSVVSTVNSCGSDLKKQKKLKKKHTVNCDDSIGNNVNKDNLFQESGAVKNTISENVQNSANEAVQLKNGIVGQVIKPKKVKKRKSVNSEEPAVLLQSVKLTEVASEASEDTIKPLKKAENLEKAKSAKKKRMDKIVSTEGAIDHSSLTMNKDVEDTVKTPPKKLTKGKPQTPKKGKSDEQQMTLSADSNIDKEGVCQNRAETSDIGESIASTSGGSEQNTPVHEPESKDEGTCADSQVIDKENHDTGLESGGDDTVKRYKKRLDFVKCDQCSHQARGKSALSRHMKKIHMLDAMMPFRCSHCNYGSTKMASLNRHLFTHGVFPCSRCSFVATERARLMEHISEQHKDKLDVKMCRVCNRYIKCDQVTIEQHIQECRGPQPYRCTECEKEFKYASSLRVHYHTHFPDQPKRFKCEQCDYRTNYKANLHKHNKNMHASKDHDVQCPDCGKLFSTEDNMKRHRKVHTLNRPFACGMCDKKFKTSGALKGHQLIHTVTRPYPCDISGCNRTFRTPKFLKSHQEEFHRLIAKKFFCSVDGCNYSFFKRSHLKRHSITHTGERNFHCTWPGCSKSFRHSDNLKVHFRAHTNEKPFLCHLCDFKCKQKNSLFWHKKRVHQIVDFSIRQRQIEFKLKPSSIEPDMMKLEPASDEEGDQAVPAGTKIATETIAEAVNEVEAEVMAEVAEVVAEVLRKEVELVCEMGSESSLVTADVKREEFDHPASGEPGPKSVNVTPEEPGSRDLYEFKSDDDSGDETPSTFRRDKSAMNSLTPLPPPPKELLRRNEIQEMKEREKKEKAEKREQERKEKADRKEQEKCEKAAKKNLEKKAKAEQKQLEKEEKLKKIEQEKKEKVEKKEIEKKEKVEKKEQEKKQKQEMKELEKKEKIEQKELKKKEKIEKKQQELREKIERREQEKREKLQKREQEKKEKIDKKLASKVCEAKKRKVVESSDDDNDDDKAKVENSSMSCPSYLTRRKSPAPSVKNEPVAAARKPLRGRRQLLQDPDKMSTAARSVRAKAEKKLGASSFKNKILFANKGEAKKSSFTIRSLPRVGSVARKVKRVALKRNLMRRCKKKGKLSPPKRKPSARIKANNKAKTSVTTQIVTRQKSSKVVLHTRKSVRKKTILIYNEVSDVAPRTTDGNADVNSSTADGISSNIEEIPATADESTALVKADYEKNVVPVVRSSSPASSEEVMLQGKASPYRDFDDAENQEDPARTADADLAKEPECCDVVKSPTTESDGDSSEDEDNATVNRQMCQPTEEFSDDEVSNDIPLTPPRAPAPPPVESSEDELELEPEPTPFSVPGPNTPFSVPGPNTPFSIPPPTNLMQQHSVHSEDAPVSAVPSVDVHSQGSLDMSQSLESAEIHPHGSVEMNNSHGSVEVHHPPGSGSAELADSHNSLTMRSLKPVEVHSCGSTDMVQSHGSVEMLCHRGMSESVPDQHIRTPESVIRDMSSNSESSKYELPQTLQEQTQMDADKEYFDQYLKSLSAANNRAANGGLEPSPNGLQHLEAMVGKSHLDSKEMSSKSPISCLPTSVITSLESLPLIANGDLRARMDSLVLDRHHETFYTRETPSSLSRLPDHQTPLPVSAMSHSPAFDAFSSLNSLAAANGGRESSYLRQPENLFSTPPVTSTFIAEAMFQRQAMATPFLPPQPSERSSLSRIPDATPLRSSSSSSFLRRSGTVPGSDMFSPPTMAQNMPRHPFANAWTSQEVRPAHWQSPYLAHQSNMAATGSFFPTKDNYLTGREFMFDPSVRPSAERSMFSSISSSQSQDTYQLDRFDLSNYFPNAMTPYGSSSASLEYSRTAHSGATKPFDERYRQTAASAAISDFRGLPPAGGTSDMFAGFPSVNTGFNLYAGNAMPYHAPHMPENVNSAFLTHSTSAQHAMFERDYAAAAAHRSLYPQNPAYPFVDERQYHSSSKLGHGHPVAPTPVPQERDLISRSAAPESQMQDPYRSLLYRY